MLFFIDFNFLGEITWWMSCWLGLDSSSIVWFNNPRISPGRLYDFCEFKAICRGQGAGVDAVL